MSSLNTLLICAYDVRGTLLTGGPAANRESGLVTRTHQVLSGLAKHCPDTRVVMTRTGAATPGRRPYQLHTPEGLTVEVQDIATAFPDHLRVNGRKNRDRVSYYYEDTIDCPSNPVWSSLADQYSAAARHAAATHILAQSINPAVALLKAHENGLLKGVKLAAVINDFGSEFISRIGYIADRIRAGAPVTVIAISEAVQQDLLHWGVPEHAIRKVCNGLDVGAWDDRCRRARVEGVWEKVRDRNNIPADRRIVLVSARRVAWKGQLDVIEAARVLAERDALGDAHVVINGAGMLDTRALSYQRRLEQAVTVAGLPERVSLLDELTTREEVAACYVGAHVAVHPSRTPEPFGYSNLEAMLTGVPLITTGHGGPLEYVEHGTSGLLVPPCAPQAIADALETVLGDTALHTHLRRHGRASAERFSTDAMWLGYQDALTSADAL